METSIIKGLSGKRILLGMGGSISAYRAADLIRSLRALGADVQVAPTRSCTRFIGTLTLETLSGKPCLQDVLEVDRGQITHVEAAYEADCVVIAPATASLMARMVQGLADEALLATLLSFRGPLLIAPAMETRMWDHPATQENVNTLKDRGAHLIGPVDGPLASGRQGLGRLAPLPDVIESILCHLRPQDLAGQRMLVTAGPTVEDIDPVRFLSNRSTGRMGVALARAAAQRGADVEFVHGPLADELPHNPRIRCWPVRSAAQMREAVHSCLDESETVDVAIMAAAVADFTPETIHGEKIKKSESDLTALQMVPTDDILAQIGQRKERPFLVGFAAETQDVERNAREKLVRKGCDVICANRVGTVETGFASADNEVMMVFSEGQTVELPKASKDHIADGILEAISKHAFAVRG
jgi:phosphopantothenoylcysteine decarboxylase / phosphopantothenate---cysteine ligase